MDELQDPVEVRNTEIVFPSHANHHGTMFGGHLVAMMDRCAFLCGTEYCHRQIVTVAIDSIEFTQPVRQGQIVEFVARIVFVGRTSMVVKVAATSIDPLSGTRLECCTGYFTVVALDQEGKPVQVPALRLATDDDRREWEQAKRVREALLARRRE